MRLLAAAAGAPPFFALRAFFFACGAFDFVCWTTRVASPFFGISASSAAAPAVPGGLGTGYEAAWVVPAKIAAAARPAPRLSLSS